MGREAGHRRRLSRFVLDVSESRKFSNSVLNLATVDAPGVIMNHAGLYLKFRCIVFNVSLNSQTYLLVISYRRGLWRCLFNRIGQCESLDTWDGQQKSHAFLSISERWPFLGGINGFFELHLK